MHIKLNDTETEDPEQDNVDLPAALLLILHSLPPSQENKEYMSLIIHFSGSLYLQYIIHIMTFQ